LKKPVGDDADGLFRSSYVVNPRMPRKVRGLKQSRIIFQKIFHNQWPIVPAFFTQPESFHKIGYSMNMSRLLLIVLLAAACKTNDPVPGVLGNWYLSEAYSYGCFSSTRSTYTLNDQHLIRFVAPDRFTESEKGVMIGSGTFEVAQRKEGAASTEGQFLLTRRYEFSSRGVPANQSLSMQINDFSGGRIVLENIPMGTFGFGQTYQRIR
jgi:hypothetical protein